jgi:hypothetical protein
MIRHMIRFLVISLAVIAGVGPTSVLLAADNDACALITKAEIQKETGLVVADATRENRCPAYLEDAPRTDLAIRG